MGGTVNTEEAGISSRKHLRTRVRESEVLKGSTKSKVMVEMLAASVSGKKKKKKKTPGMMANHKMFASSR